MALCFLDESMPSKHKAAALREAVSAHKNYAKDVSLIQFLIYLSIFTFPGCEHCFLVGILM